MRAFVANNDSYYTIKLGACIEWIIWYKFLPHTVRNIIKNMKKKILF